MKERAGFTLLEAMIVVAIVAILATVAIPSYRTYMCNSRRADGKVSLVQAAQTMERYFSNNNTYVGATIGNNATDTIRATTGNGFYTLSFSAGPGATAYTIQAAAQNDQTADTSCLSLFINDQGLKTPAACW